MKYYICDECKYDKMTEPEVVLKGATGVFGGILMPERLHIKHFCSQECFWNWIEKAKPKNHQSGLKP